MNFEQHKNVFGEVIKNLKSELDSLTILIKQARECHNFTHYKNMILAYKEILKLYKEMVQDETVNFPITYNFHIENIKADDKVQVEEFFKRINEGLARCGRL